MPPREKARKAGKRRWRWTERQRRGPRREGQEAKAHSDYRGRNTMRRHITRIPDRALADFNVIGQRSGL